MNRPWDPLDLTIVRRLASQGAPSAVIGMSLDRPVRDVDLALWTMLGRSTDHAAAKLNGVPVLDEHWGPAELDALQLRVLAWLSFDSALADHLADQLGVEPEAVDVALQRLADAGLVDAYEGPPPHSRQHFRWFAVRRTQ